MQTAVGTPLRTVALHTVTAIVTVGVALSLAIIPHVPTRAQAWTATTQHQCWIHGALLALHFVACAASQALHRWHRAKGYLALGRRTIDALPLPLILVASAHAALSVVWTWSSASNEETSSQMMLMGTLEIVRLVVLGAEAVAVSLVALRNLREGTVDLDKLAQDADKVDERCVRAVRRGVALHLDADSVRNLIFQALERRFARLPVLDQSDARVALNFRRRGHFPVRHDFLYAVVVSVSPT
jgi:hypothetical protein